MKRVFALFLILLTVLAVASCGEEKKKDVVKEKVAKEVPAEEGGTVSTSDESVTVDIPADALDSDTTITVSVYESSHYSTAKGEKVVSTVVEFEPSGTVFKKPVIIKMTANKEIKDKVVAAAVYNEAKGAWSYSEHSEYAVLVGRDAAGDPIMQTAAGDPIMLNAAGDPIMMSAAGDPIMLAAAGDPIMLASAGDPIMTNAAGDPIMNAAAGDPIMMTTGHFTAYTFIEIVEESDSQTDSDTDSGDADDTVPDEDADEPEYVPECGNGILDEGEECDNGSDNGAGNSDEPRIPGNECREDCTLVRCGDAIVDEGEECDDGSDNGKTDCEYDIKSCDVCTTECKKQAGIAAYCGDGVKQDNEKCDDGNTANGDYCSADCKTVTGSCGDGVKQDNEKCDDGNTADGDYCSADCQTITGSCGDGVKQNNEKCDDGNTANGDYCSADCQAITGSCGDGTKQSNEKCDDGNVTNGDYCSSDCQTATGSCGDGVKQDNEACDDGNTANGDYCSADCQAITGSCGDGTKQSNEKCDDGNVTNGDYCSSDCQTATGSCGDGVKQDNEACDDGNTANGDYCSADCQAITGTCGDGTKQSNEACDDGNTANGDYCSADCQAVTGSCGDEIKQDNEKCDDGNTEDGDYCSADCQTITGSCGDEVKQSNEACDDGNTADGDYCSADCQTVTGFCGDGTKQNNEACDDGNTEGGDSCSADCQIATFSCGTLPDNAQWVIGGTYETTWDGTAYSNTATAHYAEEGDCAYKCKPTYNWIETNGTCACADDEHVESGVCKSNTGLEQNCANLPANAAWVAAKYTPFWIDEAWSTEPAATYFEDGGSECTYKCVSNFHYEEGSCKSDTKPAESCGTLPANAQWVNGNTYIPTWYGEGYTSASANYAQEGDCAFTCKQTFEWVETNGTCACPAQQHVEDGVCKSDTGDTENCTNLPDNAEWHDSAYTPHWSNGAWSTEPAATYFEDGGSECTYKCISDFHYEDGNCQSDTKPAVSCGTLPENAEWVNGNTYIPTWYGEGYTSASANHAEEGDCAYKCKSTYSWIETHEICACTDEEHVENGLCKSNTGEAQNCTHLPEHAAWVAAKYTPFWIDEAWSSEPAATYYEEEGEECTFECVENYHYEDENCLSDTHPAESCGELPENAEWVNGDTYIPTWNGEEYTSASANYAEEGDCAYRCKSTYSWVETNGTCACPAQQHVENGLCVPDTGEAQNCMNLPEHAEWAAATYTPHWNGEEWTGEPAATYYEEEGEECTYTCAADYHYEEESCQSDTKPAESCGELPENAEWVQGSTYIPTWNGKGYPYATAHYAEEGDCAFVCVEDYEWNFDTVECEPEPYCGDGIVQREDCSDFDENCVEREGLNEECDRESENGEITNCEYGERECTVCTFECAEVPGETSYCGDGKVDVENEEVCDKADPSVGEGEGIGSKCSDDCMEIIEVKKALCTGQTKCYNDEGSVIDCPLEGEEFYGQDASYTARQSCTPQTYEKIAEGNGRSIVDDLSTGLRWYISSNGGNWIQAYDFCDTLDTGDGREWRLPTPKELMSIIDSGSSYPAVREAYFRSVFSSFNSYWSGTYYQNQKTGEDEVLIMDVGYGHLSYDSYGKEEGSNNFACVSGEEYGVSGSFTTKNISGGTVVTDSSTDLMWKAADDLNMDWAQALAYCEGLEYAGFDDWRLPNRNEFATLLNYDKEHGENKSNFEDIIGGNYWTSTFAATYGGSAGAFIIDVGLGTMVAVGDTGVDTAYTLCVRSDVAQYSAVPACDESGYTPCEDPETGIVWSQDVNDSDDEVDYIEAAIMCRESKQGGISQWRVATISEIRTILRSDVLDECHVSDECSELENEDCYDSEICETGTAIETVFRDYTFMVSGTQTDEGEGYSWRVNFKTGAIESNQGEYIYVTPSIRCVKDDSIPNVEFPYTDDENSLVWSELSADQLSWDEANEYCTEDDEYAWRLPTIEELATLVQGCHDGGCAPDIYGAYSVFGDVSTLWSSTVTRNQLPTNVETYYNVLDFMTASQTELTADAIRNFYAKVRCVADVDENPSPCDLYPCEDIENSDGTCSETLDGGYICGCDEGYEWDGEECWATEPDFPECSPESEFPCIDSEYELVWSAKSSDEMNWDDAGSYCENLTEGGYDDWRLPTIDELRTVIQNCPGSQIGGACAISDPDHLSNSDFSNDCYCDSMGSNNGYYSRLGDDDLVSLWSSSTTSGNTDRAWRVGFDDAYVYGYNKSGNNYVRCVREAFLGV